MSDSEDDVDSEKFESADENLSESDVESENFGQEAKPFQQEISDSDKTRRYRKRPERTTTATAAAPGSVKSKITERASSAISPDYPEKILKDVANQISKNIDKSLDGILKTSTSLKDAVFGTFPGSQVESAKEKLGLFDEPENFSDQEIPEVRTESVFKQPPPKESIPDARDQNQRDEEVSVSKVSKPEKFSNQEIPEERTESVCKETPAKETIPDARDQNQQDEEALVSKVIQPLQSPEQVAESTTLPKGGEQDRQGNEQSVSELTPPPPLPKESTSLAKSEEREVKLGKETRNPAEKLVLETESTSDLGTTEGWDDFDFDEDEAVVLDTVSTEKIDSGSIDPFKTKSSSRKESVESSWGLSGWGVGSLLDTATAVTRGISTVLESGLGVPDPETLAASTKSAAVSVEREETLMQDSSGFPDFGITSLVAGVTSKIVEKTKVQEIGSKVISGGLDTLENIGKKTMQVLQEGDPGLKKKKALLLGQPDKPVLSRILREAKEKAETEDRILAEKEAARNCRFETLFDDFQGLVHLEALEMLSRQCELKLEQLRASSTEEEKQDLDGILAEVKELCDIEETEAPSPSDLSRFKFLIEETVEPLKSEISTAKIVQIHEEAKNWLAESEEENLNPKIVYRKAMSTMAELTAATAHQFHKAGELLAVKERRKTVEEAETLMQLTNILCAEVDSLSKTFSSRLEKINQDDSSGVAVRTIKLESENAVSYIKQAFNLLIPVLQLGAT